MVWESPKDAMPWVGLYTAIASLICTLAMTVDVVQAFWKWKLWFPNVYFTLNASTITLIAIAMKLPMDLTTDTDDIEVYGAKFSGIGFLITMLANFLPSLGLMDDKELLMNIAALVALTISQTRKQLEHRYNESRALITSNEEKNFSSKELKRYVKRHWIIAETHNPQFVVACLPVSSCYGVICVFLALISSLAFVKSIKGMRYNWFGTSDYKWSLKIVFLVQAFGIVVGSIAPIFRCFTYVGHYNRSMKWSKNSLNVFRVEKHWMQGLQQWKRTHVHSHIPGRRCKIIFQSIKNTFLHFCIIYHIAVLVVCKTICLVPRTSVILLSCCWYFFKSVLKRFKKNENTSNINESSEIEEYTRYAIQIDEDERLSNRLLRNTLHSITKLINASEEKEPHDLIMLLQKSIGFNGVVEFDNNEVPSLYPEEIRTCWSLVLVTLTTIAIALPNIGNDHFKRLLSGLKEGLQIVSHIEECLYVDVDSIKARKAAIRVWTEVEIYHTWLKIHLRKKACKENTSKEILKWLGDEAAKIVIQFKSSKKTSIDQSPNELILAGAMYKISQTILLYCHGKENWPNNEELFEWISTIIADVLAACFTNLPHVIKLKCHHHAIEKRGDDIQNAAQLLGKSEKILKILEARQLPNIDRESMVYIDKWRVLSKSQSTTQQCFAGKPRSSSLSESLIVSTI
ncbi:hypothetical protein Hdeb2414_s0820g00950481 [Helianthus debilis subsp. tardiflorus]